MNNGSTSGMHLASWLSPKHWVLSWLLPTAVLTFRLLTKEEGLLQAVVKAVSSQPSQHPRGSEHRLQQSAGGGGEMENPLGAVHLEIGRGSLHRLAF